MHKTVNHVVGGLVNDNRTEWEMMPKLAETILRCSPMTALGNRCPYEVNTGTQPKLPTAMFAEHPREYALVTQCVHELVKYMRNTY